MQTRSKLSRKAATGILIAMSMYLPAALAAEKSFDRTLSVNGPVTLHVSTGAGYIHVSPGSDNQVHIVGHVKGNSSWWGGGSAEEAVAKVADNPPIDQAGNIIRVGDEHGNDSFHHVSIDYDITTPTNTMLVAESGSGTFSSPISLVRSRRIRDRVPSTPRSWALVPGSKPVREASTRTT